MKEKEDYIEVSDVGWICPRCESAISPDCLVCPVCSYDEEDSNPNQMNIFLN